MYKYIYTITFILIFTVSLIGLPLTALSADEVSIADNTFITVGSNTFWVMSGGVADSLTIGATTIIVGTSSANSTIEFRSYGRITWSTDSSTVSTDCSNASYSKLNIAGNLGNVTVTPSSTTCAGPAGGGGGGGGGYTPSPSTTTPTTTTGSVIATVAGGGNTTLTTDEDTTAQVEIPANALAAETEVIIGAESKADVVASRPVPSGKSVVGGYTYNYTATSGGAAVTNFSEDLTLTFGYTDAQIADLNEDSLKVFYWDGSQWVALTSVVDKANNQISATTNHFTYFAIFGGTEAPSEMANPADYGLEEGDLIRAVGDFDIFIISQYGYKRLFLNPAIFEMYGHLGSWDDVKAVAPSTRDAFITSTHYRYVNEDKVYHLEVTGEDTGTLQWINMTAEDFSAQGGTANAIFTINKSELDWYPKGVDKTSL